MNYKFLFFISLFLNVSECYITSSNMIFKPSKTAKSNIPITRKTFIGLLGSSLIPIKKSNAITKCDVELGVERNKNKQLYGDLEEVELYWILNDVFILFFIYTLTIGRRF